MESRKLVDVEKKYNVNADDQFVVEDEDGTKTVKFSVIQTAIQKTMSCNTINNLKTLSLTQGAVIRTLGYHKVNDGGAATYFIDYDPSATDDGALCHFLNGSDTLRAKLIQEGSVSVLAFGAVGDGVNDDYQAIQKALDSDLPIYFPTKTYKLSSPLKIKSNTHIDFNGSTFTCPNSTAFMIGSDSTGASNVSLSNANIIGFNGIDILARGNKITLENISITGQTSNSEYGIRSLSDKNIRVIGCWFENLKYGVIVNPANDITTAGSVLITNTTLNNSQHCILFSGGLSNSTRITISDCTLNNAVNNTTNTAYCAIYLNSQNNMVNITNCMISNAYSGLTVAKGILNVVNIVKNMYLSCKNNVINNDSTGTTINIV